MSNFHASPPNRGDAAAEEELLTTTTSPTNKRRTLFGDSTAAASPIPLRMETPEPMSPGEEEQVLSPDTLALLASPEEEKEAAAAADDDDERQEQPPPESAIARRLREEEESIELARSLMAEEAMASYQHHFQLIRDNDDALSPQDREALQAALAEEEREEQEEHAADLDVDDEGNMSYEAMLQLGERIGDVKSERWQCVAAEHIAKLPIFEFDAGKHAGGTEDVDDSELKCLVCQCEYEQGESLNRLPCGHCFHSGDCVGQWLASNSVCPYCRQSIVANDDNDSAP